MDGEKLTRVLWEEMLYADMRANYFAELVRSYQQRDKWLHVAVLVASSSAAVAVLSELPVWAKFVAPLAATCGSFWLLLSQYGTLARDAADLHGEWSAITRDYERLWNNITDPHAEATFHQIYDRAESPSNKGAKFPNRKKRLEYWLDQASKLAMARYA